MALFCVANNLAHKFLRGQSFREAISQPNDIIGILVLTFVAVVVGRLRILVNERGEALARLEQYEQDRGSHTKFLELLNLSTTRALEADSLQSTLEILTRQIASLFEADDVFFAFWDEARSLPIPRAAYGSMAKIYPSIQFEPGETTPTTMAMQAGRPIPMEDVKDSPYISPKITALYPGCSMFAIPLIAQRRKLGSILLGYNQKRTFDEEYIFHAEIVAEHVAQVLSKLLLLEDERKQVRQLTALHDVAMTSIQVEGEDHLIERVTEIIGHNLFPDNFGILLLNEDEEFLYPHASYRFYNTDKLVSNQIPLGKGITGQVAQTGQPQRIGNVRQMEQYLDMDVRTASELCVPIRFKDRILGVINAESSRPDAFSEDDERLLVTLAGQLATTIEQLRREQTEREWFDQLAHSRDLIYSIAHITTQINRSLSENEIIQALGKELEGIGLTCIMALYDGSLKSFKINYTSLPAPLLKIVEAGLGYPLLEYMFPRSRLDAILKTDELLRPAVVTKPEEEINTLFTRIDPGRIPIILQKIGVDREVEPMRLPLVFEENLLGILWIWGRGITRSDLPILSIFAKQIGNSLERARLFEEVQSLALTDPLTGLQNRRSVFELGRIEFSRARRMERPFCCLMLDMDHFKRVNDKFGHQAGDQVLHEFAVRCLKSVREGDLVGRYGGEELIILLPETDREMAIRVAERLRAAVADQPFESAGTEIQLTVSIGIAAKDENTTHLEALIARADQALYIAKHKGRNRVAVSV